MEFKYNKKGAVELSLNLIIMLVIGLTVLGLIIAFVTGFLGDAEKSFGGKIGEDDQNKLDQIMDEDGNLVVSPATIKVKKGDKDAAKLYIKLRNPSTSEVEVDLSSDGTYDDSSTGLTVSYSAGRGADATVPPEVYGPPMTLDGGNENSYALEVFAGEDTPTGTYYAKFEYEAGEVFSQVVTMNVE